MRFPQRRPLAAMLVSCGLACSTAPASAPGSGGAPAGAAAGTAAGVTKDAGKLLVVDCLLPGQVRKLGSRLTYLTPRQAVKTSAVDCEIRGGEYVAYDRANYQTALNIWLPQAEQGDARAQNYVGEIYERGLGVPPDYATAAVWYRKAAEQGFAPAQINLGQLYERGAGVDRDVSEALTWYRRAAGLEKLKIPLVVAGPASEETTRLRQELAARDQQAEALRRELGQLQKELAARRSERSRSDQDLAREREALARARAKLESEQSSLQGQVARLDAERKGLQSQRAAEGQARAGETARLDAELQGKTVELEKLQAQLAARQADLKRVQTEFSEADRRAEAAAAAVADLERRAAERKAALEQRERKQDVALAGPTIDLIDPRLAPSQRGTEAIPSDAKERPVVGRVEAAAGLLTVLVNDAEVQANEKGIFHTTVAVPGTGAKVSIVAIDKQGKRAERSFLLQPSAAAVASEAKPAAPAAAPGIDFGAYHALLIGNQNYARLPDLETPVADVTDLGAVLHDRYGFQVTILRDATRYDMLSTLEHLRAQLTDKDNLLIYYAGHGELDKVNERGYWLPVDAEPDSRANWISNVQLTDILNAMNAKHVLVVADSCYSGALTRSVLARLEGGLSPDARSQWQRKMASQRSRMALTSGGVQPTLDGGGGRHSIFAKALLDVLNGNHEVLEADRMASQIQALVTYAAERARFEQTPEWAPIKYAGHEGGEFFFVPKG